MTLAYIWVCTPTPIHNNPGIQFMGSRPAQVEAFSARVVHDPRFKTLNGFQQGTTDTWRYIEFWTENQSAVLDLALDVAASMQLDLEMETPNMLWIQRMQEQAPARF